jgi:hypothetical protein
MKNQLSLFISILLLLGQLQAQAQTPNYVPTTGLVGWWPFNGNLNDQSGNAYNGILTGGQYVVNRNGTASSALQFTSAATGYVDLNIGSTLTGQFSVMVWVRADRTSTFVSESGACPSTVSVPMANSNQNWLIRPGNLGTNFGVGISANQNGIMVGEHANNLLVSRLSHSINSTAFNQIVATYRSDSIFLYVNGIKVRSKVMHCPSSTKNISSTVRFGGSIYSPNFAGVIDDIGIWSRALTQTEITGLYNAVEPFNAVASNAVVCSGQPVTLSINALAGSISGLTCASATNNGTLTAGTAASGVNSVVPYTGGNGGMHNGQTVTSTGITGLTATLTAGTFASGSGSLTYTITGTPSGIGSASFALNIGGKTCTLTRTVVAGTISGLTCASATNNGTLTAGVAASGVNSVVPYTGGNGGMHNGQTVTSTGITGLTATLTTGTFASGAGNLTYTISGTPSGIGTASFTLNIGGQTCTLTRTVVAGTITGLTCASATNNGTLTAGVVASGVNSVVPYTGGNGGMHNGQTVTSTGITGLTATLTAGTFVSGAGNLTYTINGTPSGIGTASFTLNIGGQTCTLTRTVVAGTITGLTCASATNNGTLTAGVVASGVNSVVPYTGGNGGMHNGQTVISTGITGLTATLTAGTFASGAGNLTYTITGTPASGGIASFALNIGGKTCTLTRTVNLPVGTIATLSCGTATNAGTLTAGTAASGVSSSVPYTGGNGGTNNGQTVTSTGVTGLTATLTAGTFASGAGNLTYTITGTPSASGTASFALNIGGKTCTLTRTVNYAYPTGTVHCAGSPTVVVEVTNPTTGKIWMDRNLGATQVAISSTTAAAYGDLYQWGRRADGHQCRTSAITTTLSSVDQPAHGSFIKTINSTAASEYDWRVPQNSNLWQGDNGINNPCPLGFRLPTQTELNNERISWSTQNLAGSFSSPLKFTCAGGRGGILADLTQVGVEGYYWASTAGTNTSFFLLVRNVSPTMTAVSRSRASSVRCIKN